MNNINNSNDNKPTFYQEEIQKNNKIKNILKKPFLFIICISLCFVIGIAFSFSFVFMKNVVIPQYANKSLIDSSSDNVVETSNNIVKYAIQNVSPSVVSITTLKTEKNFFNQTVKSEGVGSGIIFHKTYAEAFVVTNYHVIENASLVGIAIDDNEPISAKLVGKDENLDLAVLSISLEDMDVQERNNIRVAKFASSSSVNVGDYVIAIGNAIGEGITSTFGIISSTSTDIVSNKRKLNVMQTTAAINPGNSGGALINLNGEVIGINTAKIAEQGVENIGYSIGTEKAMPIIEQIINHSNPPSLGVTVTDVPQELSYEDIAGGAYVIKINKGSPAHLSGIKTEDIITSVNEVPILSSTQLVEEIKKHKENDVLKLKIIRNGKLKTIKVKLTSTITKRTSF